MQCRFQAVKEDNAEQSGIKNIPLTVGVVVFSLAAGAGTMLLGYYNIFLLSGTVLMSVGAATLMLLKPNSGPAEW
jgi:hypothetical protein